MVVILIDPHLSFLFPIPTEEPYCYGCDILNSLSISNFSGVGFLKYYCCDILTPPIFNTNWKKSIYYYGCDIINHLLYSSPTGEGVHNIIAALNCSPPHLSYFQFQLMRGFKILWQRHIESSSWIKYCALEF